MTYCLFLLLGLFAHPVEAVSLRSELNLTGLKDGIDVGHYQIDIDLLAHSSPTEGHMRQHMGTIDGEDHCITVLEFEVGRMKIRYQDQNGFQIQQELPLLFYLEKAHPVFCNEDAFAGGQEGFLLSYPWFPSIPVKSESQNKYAALNLSLGLLIFDWKTTLRLSRENGIYKLDPRRSVTDSNLLSLIHGGAGLFFRVEGDEVHKDGSKTQVPLLVDYAPIQLRQIK